METKKLQALKIIATLLVDNGLGDWRVNLKENVTSYHAQTVYSDKKFNYSSLALRVMNREQIVGITYHEIAHALVGRGHGHGHKFKSKVLELTGSMEFASYATSLHVRKFMFTCPSCGAKSTYNDERARYCHACWVSRRVKTTMNITLNKIKLVEL